jgi:hypothetical protein
MSSRSRNSSALLVIFGFLLSITPYAQGVALIGPSVNFTKPVRYIPLAPGSIGASGGYNGPAGVMTVNLFGTDGSGNQSGRSLSSGSSTVAASSSGPWAANLNSAATHSGDPYTLTVDYTPTGGVNSIASSIVRVYAQ